MYRKPNRAKTKKSTGGPWLSFKALTAYVLALFCILLAIFYATVYPSHLLWQEQNQVFLNTPHWLAAYFDHPAWLGCMAGDWLTQFYHNTVVGAIILSLAVTGCTALFAVILFRLLPRVPALIGTVLFAILMVGCSMPATTSLSFFICVAGGMTLGLSNLSIRFGKKRPIDLSPLFVILAYWMFGFGALLTAAAMSLLMIKRYHSNGQGKYGLIGAGAAVALTFLTPALLCGHYALPYSKALLYPGLVRPSMPETEYEERLAISDALWRRDYDDVKRRALAVDEPDDYTAFHYYLASALQDSLPDNLLKFPVKSLGTLTTISDKSPLSIINMMNELYYELGDMTYAERAAMMRNVFSPRNRNVRMIRRLAEINLVSEDTLAARKYLNILGKTHAYADWSAAHTPGLMDPQTKVDIERRRGRSNTKDNIRIGDNCRNILLELLESNPGNTLALDYLLCTDLLLKDMDTFKMDYDTYCMTKGHPRHKRLYQEALMIYLAGTDAPEEDWHRYISMPELISEFNIYSNRRGDPSFSNTYWYYFDTQQQP